MAVVPRQVALSLHTEFENFTTFEPSDASATAPGAAAGPDRGLEHRARAAARHVPGRRLKGIEVASVGR